MNTFQEFYEDKTAEAELQEVLCEVLGFPGFLGSGALTGPNIFVQIYEFFSNILSTVVTTASVFLGARILGKAINFIIRKNKKNLKKFNDDADFEKKYEKEIRLAEIAEKGGDLPKSKIIRLKKALADELAEKYPTKEQSWWLELLDNTGQFLDSKIGSGGLAVLAFILL